MMFLSCYIFGPLVVLIGLRLLTKFPLLMAALIGLIGPFIGALAMVLVGELSKTHPDLSLVPGATLFFYFFFGLPIFSLWVATFGVLTWSVSEHIESLKRMKETLRALLGAGFGALGGMAIAFALYAVFSLDPSWPSQMNIANILTGSESMLSLALQGGLAGLACGPIITSYIT
jgi:hypothetical protein